jgi:two-component system, cell cycle sensor histidine kinase and response regulator CckA
MATGERAVTVGGPPLDRRLESAAELALRIAAGDLGARLPVSERGDAMDAVVVALNMLAEELANERAIRRRAEERLQDEVVAYETAPALFCSLDGESLVVENCNQTLAHAIGASKSEIIGRSVIRLFSADCRDSIERWLRSLAIGESSDGGEAYLSRAAGGQLIVSSGASRVESSDGRQRLRVVLRDVTAERRLEAQLAQAQKLEAIGRLSGGVAHDFNNILSVVTGATALLADLLAEHSLESEDVTLIEEAAARGAALTRDLLAFSRRRVDEPVSTDVRSVLSEARRMIGRLVGEDIVILSQTPPEPLFARIDPSQLSQVLINLAINARDAMPGGGHLSMALSELVVTGSDPELCELSPGPYVQLSVTDTGTGMTDEVRSRAFEPFFTTKGIGKGSGLGLSVCYGIVRQAEGRIVLRSEVGLGTRVEIYLPRLSVEVPAGARPSARAPAGGRETVLVVEDDHAVCMVTRRVLEGAGYHVLAAHDGLEALGVAERVRSPLDLLVSDITMPGKGGLELGAELRQRQPGLPVLYLSGYTEHLGFAEKALDESTDFLGKPFTASSLLGRVRRLLDRSPGRDLEPGRAASAL